MDRRVFVKQFSLTFLGTAILPMGLSAAQKKLWGKKITPQVLFDEGKLDVVLPEETFNPTGNWEQTWRVWLPFRGKVGEASGYIGVKRSVAENSSGVNYSVEQAISENNQWMHFTKVNIRAKNNAQGTPVGWKAVSEYIKAPSRGPQEELRSYKTADGSSLDREGDNVCISFTLLDTVQRMSVNGVKELAFTLLDELDKKKKNHVLRYKEETSIQIGGREVAVRCYEQIGEGTLPWMYYVDGNGRLLLAISGMRVLIADTQCKQNFQNTYPALKKVSIPKRDASSEGRKPIRKDKRPNILFLTTDQQAWNTMSSLGNSYLNTPNLDKLARKGVTFSQCYSPNPICSPTRASWITGLATSEHGVLKNGQSIIPGLKTVGHSLRDAGYETVFAGKLHVGIPNSYGEQIPGFDKVLCMGIGGKGTLGDQAVSSIAEGYLQNRDRSKPFYLTVNFLQPHDICNWIKRHKNNSQDRHLDSVKNNLPPLPDNFNALLEEPQKMVVPRKPEWTELDWRYYLWAYYRMVEEVDTEIGRVLKALEETGEADNTVILFNSDHGEGGAHHQSVTKNYLYDEACRVPMIISFPKELKAGVIDQKNLLSCLDVVPTVCDFAGAKAPHNCSGVSIRELAAGNRSKLRDYVVSEVNNDSGRMVRSENFKLIAYRHDPNSLLFDMKNDPGETRNLAKNEKYQKVISQHFQMLRDWEAKLVKVLGCNPFTH
ncbi:MAG: sulfatase [Marinifilaceae bacterium]